MKPDKQIASILQNHRQ